MAFILFGLGLTFVSHDKSPCDFVVVPTKITFGFRFKSEPFLQVLGAEDVVDAGTAFKRTHTTLRDVLLAKLES